MENLRTALAPKPISLVDEKKDKYKLTQRSSTHIFDILSHNKVDVESNARETAKSMTTGT